MFDGISCGQIALNELKIKYNNYFSSEIDKYAIQITQKNYPNTNQIGCVTKIKASDLPRIDLLMGGSPCQDLSTLKKGDGLEGNKSKLFFEYVRMIEEVKPKWFLFENVVPRKKEWRKAIDDFLGVEGVEINSDRFVQQNRPRIYWTNIPIGDLPDRPNWKGDYYQFRRTYYRKNKKNVCPCLTANMGTGGHNVPLKSENKQDKLTPAEVEQLQSIKQNYTCGVSNTQRYKMLGNAWTVAVIVHILKGMKV